MISSEISNPLSVFIYLSSIRIDETMRVVFSIDIYLPDGEGLTPPPTSPDHTHQQRGSQGSEEEAKRVSVCVCFKLFCVCVSRFVCFSAVDSGEYTF